MEEAVDSKLEALLRDFFAAHQTQVDAEVVSYFVAGLAQDDVPDSNELSDSMAGFAPSFGALPAAEQRKLTSDLLLQVLKVKEQAHQVLPAAAAASGAQPAASLASLAAETIAQLGSLLAGRSISRDNSPQGKDNSTPTSQVQQQKQAVDTLRELCALDSTSDVFLAHVLLIEGGGRLEEAATWMLECQDLAAAQVAWQQVQQREQEERQREALELEQARKSVVQRFQLQVVSNGSGGGSRGKPPALKAWGTDASENKCRPRYREGAVVTSRGEKYIIEKQGEEWDGGSRGKVITKGKRGKGFH